MVSQKKSSGLATRSVLILDFNNDLPELETNLIPLGWNCVVVCNSSHSQRVIRQENIAVAVVIAQKGNELHMFSLTSKLQSIAPNVKWLAITMQHPISSRSVKEGLSTLFIDYFHYPVEWEQFSYSLGHLLGMAKLLEETNQERKQQQNLELVGCSELIQNLKKNLNKVAKADSAILISGETGTGKGLCAQLIHNQSSRQNEPFIVVNCGSLPSSLIHSELFGHEKGAFTGAESQYVGRIERANNGTLFLDEIGDLSLDLQVNLLKFLDDNCIERLGGKRTINVNCRIIFASHIDLENAVAEGLFREDLFHRINILRTHVPSLREYREDIELLATKYLERFTLGKCKHHLSKSALQSMLQYEWPGNVRELKNRILRAVVMAEKEQITAQDLGLKLSNKRFSNVALAKQRKEINTETLLAVLKQNNHNVSAASRQLNISRTTFYRLVKKCNIQW